jgi:hypothetical protein
LLDLLAQKLRRSSVPDHDPICALVTSSLCARICGATTSRGFA